MGGRDVDLQPIIFFYSVKIKVKNAEKMSFDGRNVSVTNSHPRLCLSSEPFFFCFSHPSSLNSETFYFFADPLQNSGVLFMRLFLQTCFCFVALQTSFSH